MDALKFPNVPITEPFTLRISGAFSYFSDRLSREACQRITACSSDISWMSFI